MTTCEFKEECEEILRQGSTVIDCPGIEGCTNHKFAILVVKADREKCNREFVCSRDIADAESIDCEFEDECKDAFRKEVDSRKECPGRNFAILVLENADALETQPLKTEVD